MSPGNACLCTQYLPEYFVYSLINGCFSSFLKSQPNTEGVTEQAALNTRFFKNASIIYRAPGN
jgi:hypothetical protein